MFLILINSATLAHHLSNNINISDGFLFVTMTINSYNYNFVSSVIG